MPYIIDYRNRLSCLQRRRRLLLQQLPRIALRARVRGVLYNQTFPLSGRKGNGIRGGFALDTTGVRGVGIRGGLALESFDHGVGRRGRYRSGTLSVLRGRRRQDIRRMSYGQKILKSMQIL